MITITLEIETDKDDERYFSIAFNHTIENDSTIEEQAIVKELSYVVKQVASKMYDRNTQRTKE